MTQLMQLREPLWLFLGLLPLAVFGVAMLIKRWRFSPYADAHLRNWVISKHRARQHSRWRQIIFTQLAWLAFAIAMAGPRTPITVQDSQRSFDTQLYVVVDLSLSMSARDTKPSRIERIKLELLDLIERMQRIQLGIVVYAAQPHVLTPPTMDKSVLRFYVQTLRTRLLPTEGSQIFPALQFTAQRFADSAGTNKAILLLSDGEHHHDAKILSTHNSALSQSLKQRQIQLYVLGIGTEQGAALLTTHSGWLEYDHQSVVSKRDNPFLLSLANLGNGIYHPITDDDDDWHAIYDQGIAQLAFDHARQDVTDLIQWREQYGVFVLLALLSLCIVIWQPLQRTCAQLLLIPLLYTLLLPAAPQSLASESQYAAAYDLYQQGELQRARELFASLPGYAARFAEASTAYQQQEYAQAVPVFFQAILDAETDQQRINAIFNLANSYFKLEKYQLAKVLYQDVLRYQPSHRSAGINLEYAIALIADIEQGTPATAQREGRGPRSADAPEDMTFERGNLSLGDSQNLAKINPKKNIDTQPMTAPQTVLQQSRVASSQVDYDKDPTWTYDITDLSQLKQQLPRIDTDEAVLWQRLFEIEEEFEAAQESPNVLPGVKPW